MNDVAKKEGLKDHDLIEKIYLLRYPFSSYLNSNPTDIILRA